MSGKRWISAVDLPRKDEGKLAWIWDGMGVQHGYIPRDYSRNPHHCGEYCFMLLDPPPPPNRANMKRRPSHGRVLAVELVTPGASDV